ncbi:MAG: DUF2953 domain-containing protein [Clostridia bacterium]|nr:DUF2953 domain-containing protein [Clostridia bacterium]
MIALILIAAVILCFLFSFLKVRVSYDEELTVAVSILFIRVDVLKLVSKFQNRAKKKPKKEKKKKPEDEVLTLLDKVSIGFALAKEAVSGITKTIIFEDIDINVIFGSDDAKNTAMYAGYMYSAAYLIEPFLLGNFKVLRKNLAVEPRFDEKIFKASARVFIKARLISLIIFGVNIFMAYNRMKKAKKDAKPKTRLRPVT